MAKTRLQKLIEKIQKIERGLYVYFLFCPLTNRVKIGKTTNLVKRILQVKAQSSCGDEYKLLFIMKDFEDDGESNLHLIFEDTREHGEWFRVEGSLREFLENSCGEPLEDEYKNNVIVYEKGWKANSNDRRSPPKTR